MTQPEVFLSSYRVYYEDTDAGGIVYHANYLRFAERARTEWLRSTGWDHRRLAEELKILFIVRHAEISYNAPARLDDLLQVKTNIAAIGNTSLKMDQSVWRDDKILAAMNITLVTVNLETRPVRLPPQLRQIFSLEAEG